MSDSPFDDVEDEQVPRPDTGLSISSLMSAGVEGLVSVTGAIAVVGLTLVTALTAVFLESIFLRVFREVQRTIEDPELAAAFEEVLQQNASLDAAFDIPVTVSLVALLVLPFIAEVVRIVAIRAFHANEYDGIPSDLATRRLGWAVLSTFVGGILLGIAVGLGILALIVPGVIVFIGTVVFKQEVAIADKGVIDAIRGSWNLTKGSRWDLLGLMALLFVIGVALGVSRGVVGAVLATATGTRFIDVYILSPLTTAVITVFSIAVVTEAYGRLVRDKRDGQADDDDEWNLDDDEWGTTQL